MAEVFCEGQRVYLRLLKLSDIPLVVQWKNDPLVHRMALGPDVIATLYSERKDIKRAAKSEVELYLIIILKQSDRPVGYVRINWMDASHRFAEVRDGYRTRQRLLQGCAAIALYSSFLARNTPDRGRGVRVQYGKHRFT